MGCGRDDHRHLKAALCGLLVKAHAEFGTLYLTGADQGVGGRFGELSQRCFCSYYFIAKMLVMYFLWQADQTYNLVLALLLNDVDTRTGMATGTDKNQAGFVHSGLDTRLELLGMLIKRCDSDCAIVRSIRGQSLKCANSCIKIQAGRVM